MGGLVGVCVVWVGKSWGKNLSYYLEMSQEMSILAFARQTFKTRNAKHEKTGFATIMLLFRIFGIKNT